MPENLEYDKKRADQIVRLSQELDAIIKAAVAPFGNDVQFNLTIVDAVGRSYSNKGNMCLLCARDVLQQQIQEENLTHKDEHLNVSH